MKLRFPVALCGLGCFALTLSGCTIGQVGQAQPQSPDPSPAATRSVAGHAAAPIVVHPLDASAMVAEPCSSLAPTDISALGLANAAGRPGTGSFGRTGCTWAGDSGGVVNINWVTADRNGLSDLYAKSSTIAYWQPTTIDGYPAAYGDSISDSRAQGSCVLSTAVSDQLYFFAQIDNPVNPSRSCALAATAAADVIKELGGA